MQEKTTTTITYALLGATAVATFCLPRSLTVGTVTARGAGDPTILLLGVVRDFESTHADFGVVPSAGFGTYAGTVATALAGDHRPVFTGTGAGSGSGGSDPDLIAHWTFDEGTGTVAAGGDPSLDGTLQDSPVWTTGRLGGGLHFDGVDDYVNVPASATINIGGDYTIAGWFKLDAPFDGTAAVTQMIMEKTLDVNHDMLIALTGADLGKPDVSRGALVFKMENGPDWFYARYVWTNQVAWQADQWYHFAVVVNSAQSSQNKIFINGVDDTDPTTWGTIEPIDLGFSADLNIGGRFSDNLILPGDHYFGGVIDDIQIYRRALSDTDFPPFDAGGGFRVLTAWQDNMGRDIAPHVARSPDTTVAGLFDFVGVKTDLGATLTSNAHILPDPGESLVVETNAIGPGQINLNSGCSVDGDVSVGPGGDPAVVITLSASTISGTQGTLASGNSMPVLSAPAWLGGPTGDYIHNDGTTQTISTSMHVNQFAIQNASTTEVSGNVVIQCDGNFMVHDNSQFNVLPGSMLTVYVAGEFNIQAGCTFNNLTQDPGRALVLVTGVTDLKIQSSAGVYANIAAPAAALNIQSTAHVDGTFIGSHLALQSDATFTAKSGSLVAPPVYDPCGNLLGDAAGLAGDVSSGGITSAVTFDQWYRDALGTNLSKIHGITLTQNTLTGFWEYIEPAFYPIDNQLYGNETLAHNFHYTYMINARFTHSACGGHFISFEGGDGAWLFIDGQLVVDLGGVQADGEQRFDVNRIDGLVDGQVYDIHLFYANRDVNTGLFALKTSLTLSAGDSALLVSGRGD